MSDGIGELNPFAEDLVGGIRLEPIEVEVQQDGAGALSDRQSRASSRRSRTGSRGSRTTNRSTSRTRKEVESQGLGARVKDRLIRAGRSLSKGSKDRKERRNRSRERRHRDRESRRYTSTSRDRTDSEGRHRRFRARGNEGRRSRNDFLNLNFDEILNLSSSEEEMGRSGNGLPPDVADAIREEVSQTSKLLFTDLKNELLKTLNSSKMGENYRNSKRGGVVPYSSSGGAGKVSPRIRRTWDSDLDFSTEDEGVGNTRKISQIKRSNPTVVLPPNLTEGGSLNFAAIKSFLSIFKSPFKYDDKTTNIEVANFLNSVNSHIGTTPLNYRTYNSLLYALLGQEAKKEVGKIRMNSSPKTVVRKILKRLGSSDTYGSKIAAFYSMAALPGESLAKFFERLETASELASISKAELWKKFLAGVPKELDTTLRTALNRYIRKHDEYPEDADEFFEIILGDAVDKYRLVGAEPKGKKFFVNNLLAEDDSAKVSVTAGVQPGQVRKVKSCTICNKKYHTSDKCWSNLKCSSCREKGHPSDRCPLKGKCKKCGSSQHAGGQCPIYHKKEANNACSVCRNLYNRPYFHSEQDCIQRKGMVEQQKN